MFEWSKDLQAYKIDGVWVAGTDLGKLNSDLGIAAATWRRQRREEQVGRNLIEQVTEDCVREVIDVVVSSITESNRNTSLIALQCRLRELHGIGRTRGRTS